MFSDADRLPIYRAATLHAAVVESAKRKALPSTLRRIVRKASTVQDAEIFTEAESEFLEQIAADFAFGAPDLPAARELHELEDRLGISPVSRRRLQWELSRVPAVAVRDANGKRQSRTTATGTVLTALQE